VCERLASEQDVPHDLLTAIRTVNEGRRERFLRLILDHYGDSICEKKIALWGASFKARTDDVRGAPALYVIDGLCQAGASVVVYDPVAAGKLSERYGDAVTIAAKYYAALEGADGLVILTEWNEFRRPDYARMAELMREKVIFDGRNLYTPAIMEANGFRYYSIGRKPV